MFEGRDVIVRTHSAGVHFGRLASQNELEVVLQDARRIAYWAGAFSLSEVSQRGVSAKSKLSVTVPEILLTEAIEVIPCSEAASAILRGLTAHE